MTKKNLLNLFIYLFGFYPFLSLNGELRIEITQGLDRAVKIAVVPFAWKGKRSSWQNWTKLLQMI